MILKVHTNIAKIFTQVLVMYTESNTSIMGLKIFLDTILLLKRHQFEGILNRIKINGMVNNYLSSCNMWRFKKFYENVIEDRL